MVIDEGANVAGKGARSFVQLRRANKRVGRLTDLGWIRDIGIFYKVFNFIGGMRSARSGQRKSNRRWRWSGSRE